jgi:hypothetical protein
MSLLQFQIGKGSRGDVTILPTLVVNNRQYRGIGEMLTCQFFLPFYSIFLMFLLIELSFMLLGKLEKGAVLKAMCSGFQESTEPAICLTEGTIIHDICNSIFFNRNHSSLDRPIYIFKTCIRAILNSLSIVLYHGREG